MIRSALSFCHSKHFRTTSYAGTLKDGLTPERILKAPAQFSLCVNLWVGFIVRDDRDQPCLPPVIDTVANVFEQRESSYWSLS